MTKKEALEEFRAFYNDAPRGDVIWRREAWNNYTDMLCKERRITTWQYENWTNPF
jgi:hypothetical protein